MERGSLAPMVIQKGVAFDATPCYTAITNQIEGFNMQRDIDVITANYIAAMLWTEAGPDSEFDGADTPAPATIEDARKDCAEFVRLAGDLLSDDWSDDQIGHDIWLTRNGHGTGFWDRGLTNGDELSVIAKAMGERWAYVGDDGLIYLQ